MNHESSPQINVALGPRSLVAEVMLYCYGTDPGQVDRLADIVG